MELQCLLLADAAMARFERALVFASSVMFVLYVIGLISHVVSRKQSCNNAQDTKEVGPHEWPDERLL